MALARKSLGSEEVTLCDWFAAPSSKSVVIARMLARALKQVQIFGSIVERVLVDVVDHFRSLKLSAKRFLGNVSVFNHQHAIDSQVFVFRPFAAVPSVVSFTRKSNLLALNPADFSTPTLPCARLRCYRSVANFTRSNRACSDNASVTGHRAVLCRAVREYPEGLPAMLTHFINHTFRGYSFSPNAQ